LEQGNTNLSKKRAESIRNYLNTAWGISNNRLKINVRNLPEKASSQTETDGMEENRRVEIFSDTPAILDPVAIGDTLRTVTPPTFRFRPVVQSDAGIASWKITAMQGGSIMKEFHGTTELPSVLEWKIDEDREMIPRTNEPIRYIFSVYDAANQTSITPQATISVEQITIQKKRRESLADKEIDRYNLILFDFASPALNEQNKRIAEFIRRRISSDALVSITGYTDRIGEAEFNQKLSQDRANTTATALSVPLQNAKGVGESELYNNDLPEGRFYCRTVNVLVETPVKK